MFLANRADWRWTLSSWVMSRAVNGSHGADAYLMCGLTREVYASALASGQGCSLGLERLSLEPLLRRFFERLDLVSVSASYVSST